MSMILSSYVFFISNFWICFCSVIHWSNSRIRALSILLRNERIDSTRLSMILSLHASRFWICFRVIISSIDSKIVALSILIFFIHRRSRLMHNRKQKENHSKNCFFHFFYLQFHRWLRLKHNRKQKRNFS